MNIRLPAEWEEQDGVLLAWPHEHTDWLPCLDAVVPVYVALAREIGVRERVVIVAPDTREVENTLTRAGVSLKNVGMYPIPTNDTWARDFGPITVLRDGSPQLLDFGFNGWGLKFPADLDNVVTGKLAGTGIFRAGTRTAGIILEGGSIESDGKGTILTTEQCLLSPNRNPHLTREEIEAELAVHLGADRFLWLRNGYLAGDDTDSHIDTLARLCPDDTILHVSCDDMEDEHYAEIGAMVKELRHFSTREGNRYRLLPLPWPRPRFDHEGQRLPATYANFLVINGAVLVPTYRDPNDEAALAAVGRAFPGREIVGIDCLPLIEQHGSLHCITMQLPKGVLS